MKKNQVDAILVTQTKRRKKFIAFSCLILLVAVIAFTNVFLYIEKSKKQYISYKENSTIDYKVYLKENDFFNNNYLDKNNKYIASLIDYIDANFNYKLSLEEKNIEYKYSYYIDSEVIVKEKNSNTPLYNTKSVIMEKRENNTLSNEVTIKENINIDYNYYNNLIKKFINIYGLDDTESTLMINLHVNAIGSCEDFESDSPKESVISLSIPLTTKTVEISFENNLVNTNNKLMQCKNTYQNSFVFLIIGILFGIIDLVLIIYIIKYEIKTRTAESVYERQIKSILNNYSSYIQNISNDFDFHDYQLLKVDSFTDMLEIRDTIKQPILMKENNDKTGTYFVIPSNTKILYVYRIKISDIKKKIEEQV